MKSKKCNIPLWAACFTLAALVGRPSSAIGAIITVPNPTFSIQAAFNTASAGDTILVGAGTYNEKLNLSSKQVIMLSLGGAGLTTLNAGGSGTAITMTGNGSRVEGFTITGGNASFGGGIDIGFGSVSNTIRNNIFTFNSGFGAAIWGNGTSPLIENNIFRNNTSDLQSLSGVVSFVNSSSPQITNNLFYDNASRAINLSLPEGNSPLVMNNTIDGNTVGIRVDARVPTGSQIVRNNILTNNGIGLAVEFGLAVNNPTFESNLVFGNTKNYDGISNQTGLNGNISGDPLFVNAAANDFRLSALSAAIDTGSSVRAPATDFAGNSRPFDGNGDGLARVDIGAYELVPEPSSTLMMLAGAGVLLRGRRRRR